MTRPRHLQCVVSVLIGMGVSLAFAVGTTTLAAKAQAKAPAKTQTKAPARPKAPEQWLTDEQGRQYKIDKLPKSQPHQKTADGRLRTVWGFVVDLAGEDDTTYWVKMYRTEAPPPSPKPTVDKAAAAAIANSYRVATKTSRRVKFEAFDRGLPTSGQWRNGFVLADINGDGHADIVHGPARKRPGPPVVFLGNGQGDWRRWTEATFPPGRYDYGDVAVADFDGNGLLDIAMGMHLTGMTALFQESPGKFRPAGRGMDEGPTGFSSRAILALDWTGSGRPDVLALADGPRMAMSPGAVNPSSGSHGLRLYANDGRGGWTKAEAPETSIFGDALAEVRLRDGHRAIVTGSGRLGDTDILFVADDAGAWTVESLPGVRPNALVGAVAVADFDGDGADDIVLGYRSFENTTWRSGIDLLLQQPSGGWKRQPLLAEETPTGISALAAGDLNGDKLPDLAAGLGGGRVVVLVNSGKSVFTREPATLPAAAQGPACRVFHLAIADLTGDGRGEVVAAFAGEEEGMLALKSAGCIGEGSLRAWRSLP